MIAAGGRAQGLTPSMLRLLVTICVMMATIMQVLDITIANVSLPYMQGSLSATIDQVSWVLTSYIVAAAIMTAPVGWLAARFGAKNLLITCAAGPTVIVWVTCGGAASSGVDVVDPDGTGGEPVGSDGGVERQSPCQGSDMGFLVVGTGVDPVTFRFSGGRSAD